MSSNSNFFDKPMQLTTLFMGATCLIVLFYSSVSATEKSKNSFRDCDKKCPEMVVVPAGTFLMGNIQKLETKFFNHWNGNPAHQVRIGYAFAVGKYEVTLAEYQAFISATAYESEGSCRISNGNYWVADSEKHDWNNVEYPQSGNHPVACVSWHDAFEYTKWLSAETGESYRLLSEAEWEYAARGGTRTLYNWGDQATHDNANYGADDINYTREMANVSGRDRWEYTAPVGSFAPNNFGLFDMHGNVHEWVQDCLVKSYDDAPIDGSANLTGDCLSRMHRGGSWSVPEEYITSSRRLDHLAEFKISNLGFRIARDLRK